MRNRWWVTLVAIATLALGGLDAAAGKGGNGNGNGGGGGGGSGDETANHELVFNAQIEVKKGHGFSYNRSDLFSSNVDATGLTELSDDEGVFQTTLRFDPRGEVVYYYNHTERSMALLDPDTGDSTLIAGGGADGPFTHRRDATGELLDALDQRVLVTQEVFKEPARFDTGELISVDDIVLRAVDRVGADWTLTDLQNTWDSDTGIFERQRTDVVMYVPEQDGVSGLEDRAWVIYKLRTETWEWNDTTDLWDLQYDTVEWRRKTLDTSDWDTTGPVEIAEVVLPSANYEDAQITQNGQYAYMDRSGVSSVVAVDFSSGAPEIPLPTASDEVAVSPPSGWEADYALRAASDDGATVAVLLRRMETIGKGKSVETVRVPHLFVSDADGSGLTQIDVEGDGVNFREDDWPADFATVAFRPAAP